MIIPLRTDSPLRSTPYMNWAIIAVNVAAFIVQTRAWGAGVPPWALNPYHPELLHYFTYQFLHGGVMHLVGNMLFLYIFGNNVNDKMGHLGYLAFYLAGGIMAGMAYVLWDPGRVGMIGASGAISAITGAYLILFPRSSITILYFFMLMGTFEIACFWFILAFFVMDLFGLSGASDVAHIAHVGGTVFGAAVCIGLLSLQLLPRDQFDVVALIKQWNRRRQYRDAVSAGWNPYVHGGPHRRDESRGLLPTPPRLPAQPTDPRQSQILQVRSAITDAVTAHNLPRAADLYIELKLLDSAQVLPRQAQLDVANQLAGQQRYSQAAEAYESFLRHYPKFEQIEQVELMLGLIYARYLGNYARAREFLVKACARLHSQRELDMARSELSRIEPLVAVESPKS